MLVFVENLNTRTFTSDGFGINSGTMLFLSLVEILMVYSDAMSATFPTVVIF